MMSQAMVMSPSLYVITHDILPRAWYTLSSRVLGFPSSYPIPNSDKWGHRSVHANVLPRTLPFLVRLLARAYMSGTAYSCHSIHFRVGYGVTANIAASHAAARGSIPRIRSLFMAVTYNSKLCFRSLIETISVPVSSFRLL